MKLFLKSIDATLSAIILFYVLPLVLLVIYAFYYASPEKSWIVFSVGLFSTGIGTVAFYCLLTAWKKEQAFEPIISSSTEEKIVDFPHIETLQEIEIRPTCTNPEHKVLENTLADFEEEISHLRIQLSQKEGELSFIQKEYQKAQKATETITQDFLQCKQSMQHQIEQHTHLIENSQETIAEQRSIIEKKHQHIAQLETKVRDLTYEIKTLLQLAEIVNQSTFLDEDPPSDSSSEEVGQLEFNLNPLQDLDKDIQILETASTQLKRCIDIAQKITGGSHYRVGSPRFLELAGDNYTLDLRRLFDGLRNETNGLIIFYSQKENKILYTSNQVRHYLGWGSDKFMQSFYQIIEPSVDIWKNGLSQLAFKNQTKLEISLKNKMSQEVCMHGMLGIVPTGIFRNHILGVLYPKLSELAPVNQ